MRPAFKQITERFVMFVLLLSLGSPIFIHPAILQLKGMQEMYRFAHEQLPRILEFIPINGEEKYGFKSRKEFKKADLGIPYQEYSLDKDMPTDYWRIPVTVNNENRALLRLKKRNGKWVLAGFGAVRLATELGFFEKSIATSKPSWGRIVRDFEMHCDYLQFEPNSEVKLDGVIHPMESAARIMLRSRDSINKRGYTVREIKEFHIRLKQMHRGKTPGKTKKGNNFVVITK
jgi:hypothetical protein